MAKRKIFNAQELCPADYCFDREAFEADPDRCRFTADDTAYLNATELERYEQETPMTPCEKLALRRWVAAGHGVMEPPPSKYGCVYPSAPVPGFLEVYRTDRELDAATKGMSGKEKLSYLMAYAGFKEETDEERRTRGEIARLRRETPEEAFRKIQMLQRGLHYTWIYLAQEGIWEEADQFIREHMDEPTPFEDDWCMDPI